MKNRLVLFALLPLLVAAQCNPAPQTPPAPGPVAAAGAAPLPPPADVDAGPTPEPPDPSVTPGVRLACDNLAALHCAEGMNGCYRVLQHVVEAQLVAVPLGCLVGARSKDEVHACGRFVTCP